MLSIEELASSLSSEETAALRADIATLDAALSDATTRGLGLVALRLVADIVRKPEPIVGNAGGRPLTDDEKRLLAGFGIAGSEPLSAEEALASPPVQGGVRRKAEMLATAVPVAQAAERMGLSLDTVRQRIEQGTLVAVERPTDGAELLPAFQLTETGELPHWQHLMKFVRGRPSALSLHSAMTIPQEASGGVSPREWLMAGGEPGPLAPFLAGL